jgi:hypothetical protein
VIELPEVHQQGNVAVHNKDLIEEMDLQDADFGLQVAKDGRIWVCINGVAFLRFKPHTSYEKAILKEFQ